MSHLDSSALAAYNSLTDPHLQCYFSNERIRSHLRHAGLISRRGEIVSDSEYRLRLARREHKKHVRQMLAENIVHRAIDMERTRQAEIKRQIEMISKAALVNSVKESRRRGGYVQGGPSGSPDMGLLAMHSSWSPARPKSASHHREVDETNQEYQSIPRVSRVQSAHAGDEFHTKHSSKSPNRRHRLVNQSTTMPVQRTRRPRLLTKPPDSSLLNPSCQVKMIYYGSHAKLEYDHALFEPTDEVIVMQQHCGGENLIVYKNHLKAGDEFMFKSRRHPDYPFGLSFYVKGLIDSRISTCCEYKHRHGVKLGGERGHFAIVSVEGSKPCLKCRFEKQITLKNYADSPKTLNDTDNGKNKPITISIPASDENKRKQTPMKISIKESPSSNDNYADDFDAADDLNASKQEPVSDSNRSKSKAQDKITTVTDIRQRAAISKTSVDADPISSKTTDDDSKAKSWQIIFQTSNSLNGSLQLPKDASINALLKVSLLSENKQDETEPYVIELKKYPQYFKSGRQDSFQVKFRDIGKPKQIRLLLDVTGYDDEDEDDIENVKWQLDHIELVDPKVQAHYKFPCSQWIRPSEEKVINLLESTKDSSARSTASSTTTVKSSSSIDKRPPPTLETRESKVKQISRLSSSSASSHESPKSVGSIRKPTNAAQVRRVSSSSTSTTGKNKVQYRVTIQTSKDGDGEFSASYDSQIFIRLNNQTKHSLILQPDTNNCPSFEPGEKKSFEVDLLQNLNEQPKKLTIGFYNSDIAAGKWKLDKVILTNIETRKETIFLCKQPLVRNDFDLRAEQEFQAQTVQQNESDDEQSTPRNTVPPQRLLTKSDSNESVQRKPLQSTENKKIRSLSSESSNKSDDKNKDNQANVSTRTPPIKNDDDNENDQDDDDDGDEDNEYNRIFKKKNSNLKPESESIAARPKTRRGPQKPLETKENKNGAVTESQTSPDIWRPPSELDSRRPSISPIDLHEIQNQTSRSTDQNHQSGISHTANNITPDKLKRRESETTVDEDD